MHPPLRLSRFRWLPLGVPWVVRFSLASPWVWLGLFVLGFPPFSPPVVSGLLWGCLCLVGAGRLGPPDAMEWLVVGAACCWRGRFWLLALLLLPPQLLCAVYLGAVQIKVHTRASRAKVFFAILLSKMPRLIRPSRCCCWVDVFTILVALKGISKDKSGHFTW